MHAGAGTVGHSCEIAGAFPDGRCGVAVECLPGTYQDRPGQRKCDACPDGHYTDITGAEECLEWDSCPAGWYVITDPAADVNRECKHCEEGTFTSPDARNAEKCDDCTECGNNEVATTPCLLTSNRECSKKVEPPNFEATGMSSRISRRTTCGETFGSGA